MTAPAAIPRLEALLTDLERCDTSARLLSICESAIAEWQTHIENIESGGLPRAERRRALCKARSRLGELECAARRLRIAMAAETAP
jgi:hypothetical protein